MRYVNYRDVNVYVLQVERAGLCSLWVTRGRASAVVLSWVLRRSWRSSRACPWTGCLEPACACCLGRRCSALPGTTWARTFAVKHATVKIKVANVVMYTFWGASLWPTRCVACRDSGRQPTPSNRISCGTLRCQPIAKPWKEPALNELCLNFW